MAARAASVLRARQEMAETAAARVAQPAAKQRGPSPGGRAKATPSKARRRSLSSTANPAHDGAQNSGEARAAAVRAARLAERETKSLDDERAAAIAAAAAVESAYVESEHKPKAARAPRAAKAGRGKKSAGAATAPSVDFSRAIVLGLAVAAASAVIGRVFFGASVDFDITGTAVCAADSASSGCAWSIVAPGLAAHPLLNALRLVLLFPAVALEALLAALPAVMATGGSSAAAARYAGLVEGGYVAGFLLALLLE